LIFVKIFPFILIGLSFLSSCHFRKSRIERDCKQEDVAPIVVYCASCGLRAGQEGFISVLPPCFSDISVPLALKVTSCIDGTMKGIIDDSPPHLVHFFVNQMIVHGWAHKVTFEGNPRIIWFKKPHKCCSVIIHELPSDSSLFVVIAITVITKEQLF